MKYDDDFNRERKYFGDYNLADYEVETSGEVEESRKLLDKKEFPESKQAKVLKIGKVCALAFGVITFACNISSICLYAANSDKIEKGQYPKEYVASISTGFGSAVAMSTGYAFVAFMEKKKFRKCKEENFNDPTLNNKTKDNKTSVVNHDRENII